MTVLVRCGRKYGHGLVCRRLAGHRGHHALRLSIGELQFVSKRKSPGGPRQ